MPMRHNKYPEIISEQNFHWTNEQWKKELNNLNLYYYDVSCSTIEDIGYPELSDLFGFFQGNSIEELILQMYVRMCSCLYAIETNELTKDEAYKLIYRLSEETNDALIKAQYYLQYPVTITL
jgi:hypothetical protein